MTEPRTDWVQVWESLRGSHDFAAVVTAGQQLCNAVVAARMAWREREDKIRTEQATQRGEIDALQAALEAGDDDDGVCSVVRAWHDAQHDTPWMVCDQVVCRAVVLTDPDVRPAERADVLLERAVS